MTLKDVPKIAIIGAGPCGIAMAKNLIQQGLTDITVFEKNNQLGGNWVYDEHNQHSSVYETTHIISSRRMSGYEDFPMPADYPDYPSHRQVLAYFQQYAKAFGIHPFIRFNTTVEQVTRHTDTQWLIDYQTTTGKHQDVFDWLLVANGHHWDPFMPEYPGLFRGEVWHAHQYKTAAPFKNKRVLVVGGGNSACDMAVEIARVAEKTSISMRRGQHIFPKFIFGKPTDIAFAKINWLPFWCKQKITSIVIRILQGRYAKYRLQTPLDKPLAIHPTINSELLYGIRHGKVLPLPGIQSLKDNTVYFTDGQQQEFDVIIFATGYKISFPFFSQELINFNHQTNISLYRNMMHPDFETLYFIGLFQPQGCIWPLADYQAKIVASIIAGKSKRPDNLLLKIAEEKKQSRKQFTANARHALEVDYQQFRKQLLDDLAYYLNKP